MKFIRKIGLLFIVGVILLTGCTTKNVEGNLEDIMSKLYEGIKEDELPMMLGNIELTSENIENYVGTKIEFKEGIASESQVGSIPHSIVLLRVDASKVEDIKAKIKENANPRKWICVEAENVEVLSKGDLVALIMTSENFDKIKTNFENLK